MSSLCLFCRQPLIGEMVPEHVVPDSLGGWITIKLVCNSCNHRLGAEVDLVAGREPLLTLRQEAGLRVANQGRAAFYDPDVDEVVPAKIHLDGRVEGMKKVFDRDGHFIVQTKTTALTDEEFRKYEHRQAKRGVNLTVQGRRTLPEKEVLVRLGGPETAGSDLLLRREGAKAAIEYIAYVTEPTVALDSTFDDIRTFAIDGTPDADIWIHYSGGTDVFLPRTGRLLSAVTDTHIMMSEEDRKDMIRAGAPTAARLSHIAHRMTIIRESGQAQFHLWLFSWIQVVVALPDHPDLPNGRMDYRDFTYRKTGTLYSR